MTEAPPDSDREPIINRYMAHLLCHALHEKSVAEAASYAIQKAKNASLHEEESAGSPASKPGEAANTHTNS